MFSVVEFCGFTLKIVVRRCHAARECSPQQRVGPVEKSRRCSSANDLCCQKITNICPRTNGLFTRHISEACKPDSTAYGRHYEAVVENLQFYSAVYTLRVCAECVSLFLEPSSKSLGLAGVEAPFRSSFSGQPEARHHPGGSQETVSFLP
jgi:hypothetical protein